MKTYVAGLLSGVAAVLLLLFPSAALAATSAAVSNLSAAPTAAGIQVTGKASFSGDPVELGQDGVGDAVQKNVGADIKSASIALAGRDLVFTFELADQLPAPLYSGPTVGYRWGLVVDGEDQGYYLSAGRAGLAGLSPSTEPVFQVIQDTPDGFLPVATVPGKMADGVVQWTVPMSMIGAKYGAEVTSDSRVRPGSHFGIEGAYHYYNNFGGDSIFVDPYEVPGSVQVGIATADTPVDQIVLTPADVLSSGTFRATLATPGEPGAYTVVAKACATADVCDVRTVSLAL